MKSSYNGPSLKVLIEKFLSQIYGKINVYFLFFFVLLPNQWFLINHDELIQTQTIIFTVQKNKVDLNVVLYFSTTLGKRDGMISCR